MTVKRVILDMNIYGRIVIDAKGSTVRKALKNPPGFAIGGGELAI